MAKGLITAYQNGRKSEQLYGFKVLTGAQNVPSVLAFRYSGLKFYLLPIENRFRIRNYKLL